tara:strand:- start:39572 stop:39769 length:198 start_codon:yes stop_codon:yes gene_type:complete
LISDKLIVTNLASIDNQIVFKADKKLSKLEKVDVVLQEKQVKSSTDYLIHKLELRRSDEIKPRPK